MNYLRGAVSAISAPYQYYKDINPSTLTGAIDVIVIHRPADNGASELVCSPFHVRFGKWQVLRPSDKNVNVFVNGTRIPFDMKIGEAGEAFFVFETDEDVPPDLITSPVLHATTPDEAEEVPAQIVGEQEKHDVTTEAHTLPEREPSFLDLNDGLQETQNQDVWTTPKQTHHIPALRRQDSKATISQVPRDDSDQHPNTTDSEMQRRDQRVDEALASFATDSEPHTPEVEYHHGSLHLFKHWTTLIIP
jgi:phosphatidate phosphatase LPIN